MKASIKNIRDVLGIHAKGITFTKKINPSNGYSLNGFLSRYALTDLMNNFHVYVKDGKIHVISPGRLNVSQKDI